MTPYEKRLEQDLAQARATIQAQMAEAGRLDEVIDELAAERDAAFANVQAIQNDLNNAAALWAESTRTGTQAMEERNAAVARAEAFDKECEKTARQRDQARNDLAVALSERAHYGDLVSYKLGALENDIERLRAALAEARALLSEAGPLIGATTGWPGRRTTWLEANP